MNKYCVYIRKSSEGKPEEWNIENQLVLMLAHYESKMHSERIKRGILAKKLAAKKK